MMNGKQMAPRKDRFGSFGSYPLGRYLTQSSSGNCRNPQFSLYHPLCRCPDPETSKDGCRELKRLWQAVVVMLEEGTLSKVAGGVASGADKVHAWLMRTE